VFRKCVLRTINDAEILTAAALNSWLDNSTAAFFNEFERLDDHSFAPAFCVFGPPGDGVLLARHVDEVYFPVLCGKQQTRISGAQGSKRFHVPQVIAIKVHTAFGSQKMERSQLQIVKGLDAPAVTAISNY